MGQRSGLQTKALKDHQYFKIALRSKTHSIRLQFKYLQSKLLLERVVVASVTKFGEISPLFQTFKQFRVNFVFGKILNFLLQCLLILGNFELL